MISPEEIKKKAGTKYKKYLCNVVVNTTCFPLEISGNKKANADFSVFQQEIANLIAVSKAKKGFGYTIQWKRQKTRQFGFGEQDLPQKIFFETEQDYLQYLGKTQEVEDFKQNFPSIIKEFPILKEWISQKPMKIIQYQDKWIDLLKVLHYFKQYPQPNLYIRELPIKVHTKFIEQHQPILTELLNILIPDAIHVDEKSFEKRFHLKYREPLIRFKILDQSISQQYFSGISDLSMPISSFNQLRLPIKKVIVVENKTTLYTALTLPNCEQTIAIFGKGFAVSNLRQAMWLKDVSLLYWGDLDVHGFEILSDLRAYFEHTQSILMDETTFNQFFEGDKGKPSTSNQPLQLTDLEQVLYEKLKDNNWRLEQEKIPLPYVQSFF